MIDVIDVIERLQYAETRPLDADGKTQLWQTLQDARAEITRLREAIRRLAEQDATLSVKGGNVIVQMDATLTDAEREAIAYFSVIDGPQFLPQATEAAATLRSLLGRVEATNKTDGYV